MRERVWIRNGWIRIGEQRWKWDEEEEVVEGGKGKAEEGGAGAKLRRVGEEEGSSKKQ